jgi:hypothetical protein
MTNFPKLPNKPECLGFRKTVVLNLPEYNLLKDIVADIHKQFSTSAFPGDQAALDTLEAIMTKLNEPTPQELAKVLNDYYSKA